MRSIGERWEDNGAISGFSRPCLSLKEQDGSLSALGLSGQRLSGICPARHQPGQRCEPERSPLSAQRGVRSQMGLRLGGENRRRGLLAADSWGEEASMVGQRSTTPREQQFGPTSSPSGGRAESKGMWSSELLQENDLKLRFSMASTQKQAAFFSGKGPPKEFFAWHRDGVTTPFAPTQASEVISPPPNHKAVVLKLFPWGPTF